MKTPICLIVAALAGTALLAPARADDPGRGLALADKRGCLECHALGWTNVGPGFADIATRYRYQAGTREMLVDKIRFGGAQHWGERFNMWPQTNVTEEEVYELVDWILQQ
jgi:cytochrome c